MNPYMKRKFREYLKANWQERKKERQSEWVAVHPSIFVRLSGAGLRGQQAKQGIPDIPLPSNTLQLLLGDPKTFPGQMRYIIPPVCSGSTLRPPASWTCPVNIQREASDQDASWVIQCGSTPRSLWKKLILVACTRNLDLSLPKAPDHSWRLQRRWTDKSIFFTTMDRYSTHITFFPHSWTRPQDTWTPSLEAVTPLPPGGGQSTGFRQSTRASDLVVLTLILTFSHTAANHPSTCWRSKSEEANRKNKCYLLYCPIQIVLFMSRYQTTSCCIY